MDVAAITTKRSEPESFGVAVTADKIRDGDGNRLTDIDVDLRVIFPTDEGGDKARAVLDRALQQSHDRLCTVSRTLQTATPVRSRIVTISD